ncbi:MAG: hypothetical protein ACE5RP_00280 [Nitrosopumilus sp.]
MSSHNFRAILFEYDSFKKVVNKISDEIENMFYENRNIDSEVKSVIDKKVKNISSDIIIIDTSVIREAVEQKFKTTEEYKSLIEKKHQLSRFDEFLRDWEVNDEKIEINGKKYVFCCFDDISSCYKIDEFIEDHKELKFHILEKW